MKTIPDYTVIKVGERTTLCIGGAISLDRFDRKQEIIKREILHKKELSSCWEDEFLVINENLLSEIINSGISIDTVVTHSVPEFCYSLAKENLSKKNTQ